MQRNNRLLTLALKCSFRAIHFHQIQGFDHPHGAVEWVVKIAAPDKGDRVQTGLLIPQYVTRATGWRNRASGRVIVRPHPHPDPFAFQISHSLVETHQPGTPFFDIFSAVCNFAQLTGTLYSAIVMSRSRAFYPPMPPREKKKCALMV